MLNFEEINEDFEVVCYWWCHGMGECLAVVSVVCTCFENAFYIFYLCLLFWQDLDMP